MMSWASRPPCTPASVASNNDSTALVSPGLVVLHRHDVVGPFFHDLFHNFMRASHGIYRDRGALDIQGVEQLRDRRDLVALGGGPDLTQHQPRAAVPCRHQVSHVRDPVMRTAQAFAIYRKHLSGEQGTQLLHPADEVGFEALRLQQRKDPTERVTRGDPVVKGKESLQPIHLEARPIHHPFPTYGT